MSFKPGALFQIFLKLLCKFDSLMEAIKDNSDDFGQDMKEALKERAEILYYANLKEKFSRRKNPDGTFIYQAFLDRLEKKREDAPVVFVRPRSQ